METEEWLEELSKIYESDGYFTSDPEATGSKGTGSREELRFKYQDITKFRGGIFFDPGEDFEALRLISKNGFTDLAKFLSADSSSKRKGLIENNLSPLTDAIGRTHTYKILGQLTDAGYGKREEFETLLDVDWDEEAYKDLLRAVECLYNPEEYRFETEDGKDLTYVFMKQF